MGIVIGLIVVAVIIGVLYLLSDRSEPVYDNPGAGGDEDGNDDGEYEEPPVKG